MRSKNLVASSSYYVRNMMNNNRISGHDILIHYRLSLSLFLEEEEKKIQKMIFFFLFSFFLKKDMLYGF